MQTPQRKQNRLQDAQPEYSEEIRATVSSIKGSNGDSRLEILNLPFEGINWNQKRAEYWAPGARRPLSQRMFEDICGRGQDAVSLWGWGLMQRENMRLRQRQINAHEWCHKINDICDQVHILHWQIIRGGLDSQADWISSMTRLDILEFLTRRNADKSYIAELTEGIEVGAFGSALELNCFDERVRCVLTTEIASLSYDHEALTYLPEYLKLCAKLIPGVRECLRSLATVEGIDEEPLDKIIDYFPEYLQLLLQSNNNVK